MSNHSSDSLAIIVEMTQSVLVESTEISFILGSMTFSVPSIDE